jgi:hypothetical protein
MEPQLQGLQYLERLQKQIYTHLGISPQAIDSARCSALQKTFEDLKSLLPPEEVEKIQSGILAPPQGITGGQLSPFEEPAMYKIMLNLAAQIEGAVNDLSFKLPSKPIIGTLPTSELNARFFHVPESDQYLIIFDYGMFIFALLLSKIVSMAFPLTHGENNTIKFVLDDEAIDKQLAENSVIVQRFQELFTAHILYGSPAKAPAYTLDKNYYKVAQMLWKLMELFIIGHEYGHFILGHTDSPKAEVTMVGEKTKAFLPVWNQELDADAIGLSLLLRASTQGGTDPAFCFCGVNLLLSCSDIIDRAWSMVKYGNENHRQSQETHPPSHVRCERLRETLRSWLPDGQAETLIRVGGKVERIVEQLWKRTRPVFCQYFHEGRRPAPNPLL